MQIKREPILTAGTLVALVVAILGVLVAFGLPLTPEMQESIKDFVVVAAPFIVALATWWFSRPHTTPVIDPRGADGVPLVRADE